MEFAKDVCRRLKLFNDITKTIFGSKYPTVNLYFPKICETKIAINEQINSPSPVIQDMTQCILSKFDSY